MKKTLDGRVKHSVFMVPSLGDVECEIHHLSSGARALIFDMHVSK